MGGKIKMQTPLLWILVIPVLNLFYGILNRPNANVYSLMTDLDALVPFLPEFIIPYLLWYPFMIFMLVLFCAKDRGLYYRILCTLCLGLIICYMTYYVFQTTVDRPDITGDGLLNRIVRLVYLTDQPYNCFPSIHVLTSYLMIKGTAECAGLSRKFKVGVPLCAWLIIASTLFVKQHVLLDVAGAVTVVECLWYPISRQYRALRTKGDGQLPFGS